MALVAALAAVLYSASLATAVQQLAGSWLKLFGVVELWHQLDEFQQSLLSVAGAILLIDTVLIAITWKVYGGRIADCFTSDHIKEAISTGRFKSLPKEYCPKY